jgi:hypothetical protein
MHVVALLDELADQPDVCSSAAADGVPERLRPIFEHQISSLPSSCRQVLEALAVLRPITLRELAAAVRRDELDAAEEMRPAVDAGLVVAREDGFAFRHVMTARAVHDALPPATREQWRRARRPRPGTRSVAGRRLAPVRRS